MSKLEGASCCNKMDYYVDPSYKSEHEIIDYSPETREYSLILHGTHHGMYQPLQFCPWCGKKLPQELNEEWAEMVEKELGVETVWDLEWSEIPKKYKTDEWWKKRGL